MSTATLTVTQTITIASNGAAATGAVTTPTSALSWTASDGATCISSVVSGFVLVLVALFALGIDIGASPPHRHLRLRRLKSRGSFLSRLFASHRSQIKQTSGSARVPACPSSLESPGLAAGGTCVCDTEGGARAFARHGVAVPEPRAIARLLDIVPTALVHVSRLSRLLSRCAQLAMSAQPLALPQTHANWQASFVRGYGQTFARTHDLPPEVFLGFLDGLNRSLVGSPPLQALGLVGSIVGMAPGVIPVTIGNVLSIGAGVGDRVLSKGATEMYLRKSNEEVFAPRGLKAQICTADALAVIVGRPGLPGGPDDEPLTVEEFAATLGQHGQTPRDGFDVAARRLLAYGDRLQPVVVGDPALRPGPDVASPNAWQSLSEWNVKRQVKVGDKKASKAADDLRKDLNKAASDYAKEISKAKDSERKRGKAERERRKDLAKAFEDYRKHGGEQVFLADDAVHVEYREGGRKAKRQSVLWLLVAPATLTPQSPSDPEPARRVLNPDNPSAPAISY